MPTITITCDTQPLQRAMEQFIFATENTEEVCKNYVRNGIELGVGLAQIYAPVDEGVLRDSIHMEENGNTFSIVADAVNKYGQPYAVYPEMGTVYQDAQPYVSRAGEEILPEIIAGIKGELAQMFQRSAVQTSVSFTK